MDRDDTRRGRLTVHRKWDNDVALLAGDGLLALAYRYLLKTNTPCLAQIARVFTDGIIEVCEGQALDREFENGVRVSMNDYIGMISRKTARLLALSAYLGGAIGNGSNRQLVLLTQYAENLGIAFQIQDDLLDITVEQTVLGKDFGSDIKRHKRTFLMIHALEHGAPSQQQFLRKVLDTSNLATDDVLCVREIFHETGTLRAAENAVRDYINRSQSALQELSTPVQVDGLRLLLEAVLNRNA